MSHELPHCFYRHPLGAIGENRKDLSNTNIQKINLKKIDPKASWNGGILTEFDTVMFAIWKTRKIESFERLDSEHAVDDKIKKVVDGKESVIGFRIGLKLKETTGKPIASWDN